MQTDLWAVICGNIRDELDFKLTLTRMIELRDQNKVQHIVLSTWRGELVKFDGLRELLKSLKIYVIENPSLSPEVESSASESVNYWRQARQLLAALDFIPKSDFILRLRTDRSLNYINQMDKLNVFDHYKIPVKKIGQFPQLLEYQVTVFGPKMVRLLHMIDFVLLGCNRDLYKLANFDFCELNFQKQLVANAQWFAYPFLQEFPILRDYMRFTHFVNRVKVLKKHVDLHKENSVFTEVDYKVYAIYLMILHTHFNILYTGKIKAQDYQECHFYQLFSSTPNFGIQHTSLGSSIRDHRVLEKLLFGGFQDSTSYRSFLKHVSDLIAYGTHANFDLSFSDYQQLVELQDQHFYEGSNEWPWFKPLRRPPINPKHIMRYSDHTSIKELSLIGNHEQDWIALSHTENVERDVFQLWLKLESPELEVTEKMLMPIARTGNEYAIFILLDLLDRALISPVNVEEIKRIVYFYLDIHVRRRTETPQTVRIILLMLKMYVQNDFVIKKLEKTIYCGFDAYLTEAQIQHLMALPKTQILAELLNDLEIVLQTRPAPQEHLKSYIDQLRAYQEGQNIKYSSEGLVGNDAMIMEQKWLQRIGV